MKSQGRPRHLNHIPRRIWVKKYFYSFDGMRSRERGGMAWLPAEEVET
jgi:hypothetical protein